MHIYISGYYGYKNFGDELLLLGVLEYIYEKRSRSLSTITIESNDASFLTSFLVQSSLYLGKNDPDSLRNRVYICKEDCEKTGCDSLSTYCKNRVGCDGVNQSSTLSLVCRQRERSVGRKSWLSNQYDHIYIGGGEALTSERLFPHNGWSAYIRFLPYFFGKKVTLLGGFGKPKGFFQKRILYPLYLGGASSIVARESSSLMVIENVLGKRNTTVLYQDFSLRILEKYLIFKHKKKLKEQEKYCILNINAHIRSEKSCEKIKQYIQKHEDIKKRYFFPASSGSDDSDLEYGKKLIAMLYDTDIEIRDWTRHSLYESLGVLYAAQGGIVARLHLVIPLFMFDVSFEPLVYQEKITHMIHFLKNRSI